MQEREKGFPIYQGEREPRERKDEDILDVLREQIPDEAEVKRQDEEEIQKAREKLHGETASEVSEKKKKIFARLEEVFQDNRIPEDTKMNGISNLTEALLELPFTKDEARRLYNLLISYRNVSVAYEIETADRYAGLIDKVGEIIGKEPMDAHTWRRLTRKNAEEYGEKISEKVSKVKTREELDEIIYEAGGIHRIKMLYTAKGSPELREIVEKRAKEVGLKVGGEEGEPSPEKKNNKKSWWERLRGL